MEGERQEMRQEVVGGLQKPSVLRHLGLCIFYGIILFIVIVTALGVILDSPLIPLKSFLEFIPEIPKLGLNAFLFAEEIIQNPYVWRFEEGKILASIFITAVVLFVFTFFRRQRRYARMLGALAIAIWIGFGVIVDMGDGTFLFKPLCCLPEDASAE